VIIVTGGAGFIGSNIVADLNELGVTDIVIVDCLGSDAKWRNLAKRRFLDTHLSGPRPHILSALPRAFPHAFRFYFCPG
jgi:nucleoside-diphosphate-sugar epimerase